MTKRLVNGVAAQDISIDDRGFQYGDGAFETIAIKNGKLLCLSDHLERLAVTCVRLKIPFTDLPLLKEECEKLASTHDLAVLKIIVTRGQGGRGYAPQDNSIPTRIVSVYPWPNYPDDNYTQGISTIICKTRYGLNPDLAGLKHLNRLEQVLARTECSEAHVDEGIVLDTNDNVIEGTMTNLFLVIDEELKTPDLSQCGVNGIIRQKIIDHHPKISIQNISRDLLFKATEIFLCNSLIGVWSVNSIDGHEFPGSSVSTNIAKIFSRQGYIV